MLFATTILLSLIPSLLAADSSKSKAKPCTIHSPNTGSYFDLTTIQAQAPSSKSKDARTESWHSRGYDYGANFTLNFCAPVLEDLEDVEGIPDRRAANISAFYKKEGKVYSIGEANTEPIFRGRKLVLNYTNGSPCEDYETASLSPRGIFDDDDDDDDEDEDDDDHLNKWKSSYDSAASKRTKSTIISFLCDRDPQYTDHPQISFIGTTDSCSYHFEVRSRAACGGAPSQSPSSLGPGGVFFVILDAFIIITSSLAHTLRIPTGTGSGFSFNRAFNNSGGGYHRVGDDSAGHVGGRTGEGGRAASVGRGGRGRDQDEENRLIDQLDEEWDD
ncbi:putative vacuolar sorting receptor [Phaeomoniella chlamydospora]|uniref:Putative vacuolar sorting receptor n=1 Tax=Phaeomoniella chlamydospora TaxID=158046 RepID=A0A0G2DUS5_PHACM|nr:putative vacuolar sorting receptor [Phaeomoniella chlamydospora]